MQPPARHPPLHAAAIDTDRRELPPTHHAVLSSGELGDAVVGWGCLCTHTVHESPQPESRPLRTPLNAEVRRYPAP